MLNSGPDPEIELKASTIPSGIVDGLDIATLRETLRQLSRGFRNRKLSVFAVICTVFHFVVGRLPSWLALLDALAQGKVMVVRKLRVTRAAFSNARLTNAQIAGVRGIRCSVAPAYRCDCTSLAECCAMHSKPWDSRSDAASKPSAVFAGLDVAALRICHLCRSGPRRGPGWRPDAFRWCGGAAAFARTSAPGALAHGWTRTPRPRRRPDMVSPISMSIATSRDTRWVKPNWGRASHG